MPFDNAAFCEAVSDPRYDLLKKPIRVDKDNKAYEIQVIPPATAKTQYRTPSFGGAGLPVLDSEGIDCWNSEGSPHYWDHYSGSDFRPNMQGSGIWIKYMVRQGRNIVAGHVPFWGVPAVAGVEGFGMPWNITYCIQTIGLRANQSQTLVENYNNANLFHHITTSRYLLKYKSAIEKNDGTFFTPCIESSFDKESHMSQETQDRFTTWTGAGGAANVDQIEPNYEPTGDYSVKRYYTKFIPLSDLFESCEVPAIWGNTNRFRIEIVFRKPEEMCFHTHHDGVIPQTQTPCYFYITDMKLIVDTTRMTPIQAIESSAEKRQGSLDNIGYMETFSTPLNYSRGSELIVTGQRDVNMAMVCAPAVSKLNSVVKNPTQYDNAEFTTLNLLYGQDMPLRTVLQLGGSESSENVLAYELYRKASNNDRTNNLAPALTFKNYNQYHIYFFPIYYQGAVHRNSDPRDVRISNNSNDVNGRPIVVIIRRFNGCQIDSSGLVERL